MELFVIPFFLPLAYAIYMWIYNKYTQKSANKPPLVPGAIPFIGNILGFDRKKPHLTLSNWGQRFGHIFRIKLFGEEIVVINSADAIRETVNTCGNKVAGRPSFFRIDYGFHFSKDVIFGNFCPKWVAMKKLVVQSLKDYGHGRQNIEEIVQEEVMGLCNVFSEYDDQEFDPSVDILTAVVNCLSASVLGKRFARGDPQMKSYKIVTRLFSEACSPIDGIELDLFPFLRWFGNKAFNKLTKARAALDDWIDAEMDKAKNAFKLGNPQCIFDSFYQAHLESMEDEDADFILTEDEVRNLFVDMLVSGTFTTAIALNAFCLITASIQHLQADIRKQIRNAFGSSSNITYEERSKVPLLEATIYELLRYISHVPLSLPHYTLENTAISGYHIPKHTKVLLNLWSVHHDDNTWKEPWKFNPYRFLDANGQLIDTFSQKWKNLMPFSGGRRACPGENLSKQRIFIIAGSILQKFELKLSDTTLLKEELAKNQKSDLTEIYDPRLFDLGLILEPKPFKIVAHSIDNESFA